jgi:hypothetical protein
MIFMKKYFLNCLAVCLVATAGLMSCEDPVYPDPAPAEGPSTNLAQVRFVHAAPGVAAMKFFSSNVQMGNAVSYLGATPYSIINVGPTQFRGRGATSPIGGTLGEGDVVFRAGATNQTNFTVRSNFSYTVFAGDLAARPLPTAPRGVTDPGGIRLLVMEDNLRRIGVAALTANQAAVRFVHLAPGAPAVWVTSSAGFSVTNRAFEFGTAAGSRAMTGAASGFTPVTATGSATVELRTGSATGPVVSALSGLPLEAGRFYTIYARGQLNVTGDNALGLSVIQHN